MGEAEVKLHVFSTQKCRLNFSELQDLTFQKTELLLTTGVRTSKILQKSVLISNIFHACYMSLYQNVSLKLLQSDDYHSCLLQSETTAGRRPEANTAGCRTTRSDPCVYITRPANGSMWRFHEPLRVEPGSGYNTVHIMKIKINRIPSH